MAAKKRKDISQEVAKLEDEGQDASQKALDLAKFAEATKSTFESLSPDFTEETSQAISQASHELQGNIDTNYSEVLQESEDVLDNLEQKQKGFKDAIAADRSDIMKLNRLQAEGDGTGDLNIAQVQDYKQEEINFFSNLTHNIEAIKDDINQKLNESRQRRQAARLKYKSKSLDNHNQTNGTSETAGESRESERYSHAEVETPLEFQAGDSSSTSEKTANEVTNKSAKVLSGNPPFNEDDIKTFFTDTEGESVGNGPGSHVIRDHISTGDQSKDMNNLTSQIATKNKASMFHNEEIASQAIKEVIDAKYTEIENFAKNSNTAPGEKINFHMQTSLHDLGFGINKNGNPLPRPISKVFIVIKARGDGTWLIQTAFPKN